MWWLIKAIIKMVLPWLVALTGAAGVATFIYARGYTAAINRIEADNARVEQSVGEANSVMDRCYTAEARESGARWSPAAGKCLCVNENGKRGSFDADEGTCSYSLLHWLD